MPTRLAGHCWRSQWVFEAPVTDGIPPDIPVWNHDRMGAVSAGRVVINGVKTRFHTQDPSACAAPVDSSIVAVSQVMRPTVRPL